MFSLPTCDMKAIEAVRLFQKLAHVAEKWIRGETPNDKISERGARRDACAAGSAGSRQRDARNGSLQRLVRR